MLRIAPQELREQIRVSLAIAPPALRSRLAGDSALERQVAIDRMAAMIADGLAGFEVYRNAEAIEPPAPRLPLFPDEDPAAALPPARAVDIAPVPVDTAMVPVAGAEPFGEPADEPKPETFGEWLLLQAQRGGAIGMLASSAWRDPHFPRRGDVKAVSKRLHAMQADPEMHEALEEAELDFYAL